MDIIFAFKLVMKKDKINIYHASITEKNISHMSKDMLYRGLGNILFFSKVIREGLIFRVMCE